MSKRKIIKIDHDKCNGCGECIPNCPEGAIQMIDNKARLISDLFCDGLGACIGHCPEGAIVIEEREAQAYDERKVMANIVTQGENVIIAHLKHLKEHKQEKYFKQAVDFLTEKKITLPGDKMQEIMGMGIHVSGEGCPGAKTMDFRDKAASPKTTKAVSGVKSELSQWPVQISLVSPMAVYLQDADLLIAADCVPFAYADFHSQLLSAKALLVGCPKLDDVEFYKEKITQILKSNNIKSVTCAHMEVPCCFGLVSIVRSALAASGKEIPFDEITISIRGDRLTA